MKPHGFSKGFMTYIQSHPHIIAFAITWLILGIVAGIRNSQDDKSFGYWIVMLMIGPVAMMFYYLER
jgi:hypothetical protein